MKTAHRLWLTLTWWRWWPPVWWWSRKHQLAYWRGESWRTAWEIAGIAMEEGL